MANILTKGKGIRAQIDKHMEKSVEYSNPNLKTGKKVKFKNPTIEDERRVNNYKIVEANIGSIKEKVSITAIKIDHNFKGFITYRSKPFSWNNPEITIEFNGQQEFMDKIITKL